MASYLDICTAALRKISFTPLGETPEAAEAELAREALRRLLNSWQNRDLALWPIASESLALTTSAAHALSARATEIRSVRFRQGSTETPMQQLSRSEYDDLPLKSSTGIPTTFYYEKSYSAGTLYVWPVLAATSGQTLEVTVTRPFGEIDLTETAEIPPEWEDAVIYGLAARLADDMLDDGAGIQRVIARAEDELEKALAFDRPPSVMFTDYASY